MPLVATFKTDWFRVITDLTRKNLTTQEIANELGVELYDIYGLTEVYGPGIAINCEYETGMHYFDDYLYFEIIDPKTGQVLPNGELGELVITTLQISGERSSCLISRIWERKRPQRLLGLLH